MQRVDFNTLPPETKHRFIESTHGRSGTLPIFAQRLSLGGATAGWGFLAASALFALLLIAANRFGRPYGYKQGFSQFVWYVLFLWIAVGSAFAIVRGFMRRKLFPFAPGTYVFPCDLVVAQERTLLVYPLAEMTGLQPTHHHRNGAYMHTTFAITFAVDGRNHSYTFYASPKAKAEEVLAQFQQSLVQTRMAIAEGNMQALAALDLFFIPRSTGQWVVSVPPEHAATALMAGDLPPLYKRSWLVALAPAAVLGLIGFFVRNFISDEVAFSNLKESSVTQSTSYDLDGYIAAEGRHKKEVEERLYPRYRLNRAVDQRSSLAIRAFLKRYPGSVVEADAKSALVTQGANEFSAANVSDGKGGPTVAKLRMFVQDNPESPDVSKARATIHTLFQSTLSRFRLRASRVNPDAVPFMEGLITHLETNDSPAVAVRFHRVPNGSLAQADALLEASLTPEERAAGIAKASPHFDASSSLRRERKLVELLQKAFGNVFPADILALELERVGITAVYVPRPVTEWTADELESEMKRRGSSASMESTIALEEVDAALGTKYASSLPARKTVSGSRISAASPQMNIRYSVNWPPGSIYKGRGSERMFVGIRISFDISMEYPGMQRRAHCPSRPGDLPEPGKACSLQLSLDVKPPQSFKVESSQFLDRTAMSGSKDSLVYEVMAARAYDELSTKLTAAFFQPGYAVDKPIQFEASDAKK